MKKHTHKLLLLLLLTCLLASLLLTSCETVPDEENAALRALTEQMIDALLANDAAAAYALVSDVCTEEEFLPVYDTMYAMTEGVTTYELTLTGVTTGTDNGITYQQSQYRMTTNGESYLLSASLSESYENLAGFQIAPESATKPSSGTLSTLADSNIWQWLLLLFALLETGFVLWAVIDCARHRVNGKALWILLILLGSVSPMLTISEGSVSFSLKLGLFLLYTALMKYGSDLAVIRIMLPIGAIVYTCLRKKLFASYTETPPSNPYIGTSYEESPPGRSQKASDTERSSQEDADRQPTVDTENHPDEPRGN